MKLVIIWVAIVCAAVFVSSAQADEPDEDALVGKYEKILDEFDNQQPAGFKDLFKAKRVDRLKKDFEKLNGELLKRVPNSEEPEENMRAAAEWLKSAKRDGLAEALEYFVSLEELNGHEKCNGRSETILRLNDYLTDGRARSDDSQTAARRNRVDKIVRHFAVQHEQQCRDAYAQKYKQKLAEMNPDERERLFGMLGDEKLGQMLARSELLIELMFIGSNVRLAKRFQPTNKLLASYLYSWLMSLSFQTHEPFITNGAFDQSQFELAYEKHLVKPCQNYVSTLGREVFSPAILDLGTSSKAVMERATMGDDESKYVLGLGRFAICDSVLRQGETFKGLVLNEAKSS